MQIHSFSRILGLILAVTVAMGCSSTQSQQEPEDGSKKILGVKVKSKPNPYRKKGEEGMDEPAPAKMRDGMIWTSRAYPTGNRRTSTVLIERGAPAEVNANTPYEYVIKVTNLTGNKIEGVVVNDRPTNNFQLKSSTPNASRSGGALSWNLGSLGAKQSETIRVSGTAPSTGDVTCCCDVSWESLLCTTTRVVNPALSLTKTGTRETLICDPITYTVKVTNSGTGAARNVVIEDRLPDGLKTMSGKSSVKINVGTLASGQSRSYTIKAKADRTGSFSNSASAMGDGGLSAKSGTVNTKVTRPVLQISKSGTANTFLGRNISYEMTVKNTGDGPAKNTVITDPIPAGASFVSASSGGTNRGGVVTWNLGTLKPGDSRKVSMKVKAGGESTIRNTATAKAYCAKAVSDTAVTQVTGIPAILLEVIDIEDPIEVGGETTYVITVTNQGSAKDTNIRIVAELENQESLSNGGATNASKSGNRITFEPLRSLAPKAKAQWRVRVKAAGEGSVRFRVKMTSDQLKRPVEETEATNQYK